MTPVPPFPEDRSQAGAALSPRAAQILERIASNAQADGPSASRLLDDIDSLSQRTQAARHQLERLEDELARLARGLVSGHEAAPTARDETVRLLAVELAALGGGREEVAATLRTAFEIDDPAPIVQRVFGPVLA